MFLAKLISIENKKKSQAPESPLVAHLLLDVIQDGIMLLMSQLR